MAIIRIGQVIGGISGSIGGTTFVNSSFGLVARRRLRRTNKCTKRQLEMRRNLQVIHDGWLALTDLERGGWEAFARNYRRPNRLGVSRAITTYQLFVMQQMPLQVMGMGVTLRECPTYEGMAAPYDLTLDFPQFGALRISWRNPVVWLPFFHTLIFGARPQTAYFQEHAWRWRFLEHVVSHVGAEVADVTASWVATWGRPALDEVCVVRIYNWHAFALRSAYAKGWGRVG